MKNIQNDINVANVAKKHNCNVTQVSPNFRVLVNPKFLNFPKQKGYVAIPNEVLDNRKISMESLAFMAWILTNDNIQIFGMKDLLEIGKTNEKEVLKCISELLEQGYVCQEEENVRN